MNIINIYDNYNSYFNADLKAIFEHCSKIASLNNYKIYLIGGLVRDLLLNVKSFDIDITVEGNAIGFAKCLEKENLITISSIHENFGTVKIKFNGQNIDLASTRNEIYPHAGHLPVITQIGCSLKEDILRRDFTVNSLAMSLNQENFGELIDFVNGFEDLKNKKLKILHDKSFIDDPTRIIRGLKYASRLGFELDVHTRSLQDKYLANINYDMCYKRIKQEIVKTFNEATQRIVEKFVNQGIYKLMTPHPIFLTLDSRVEKFPLPQGARENYCNDFKLLLNVRTLIKQYTPKHAWLIWIGILFCGCDLNQFNFTKYEQDVLQGAENLLNSNFSDDFEIYKVFSTQKIETLLILANLGKEKEVLKYLNELQKISVQITGEDLINEGFKPSKKFSEVFDYILKEKIKNPTKSYSKNDELTLAKAYLN